MDNIWDARHRSFDSIRAAEKIISFVDDHSSYPCQVIPTLPFGSVVQLNSGVPVSARLRMLQLCTEIYTPTFSLMTKEEGRK